MRIVVAGGRGHLGRALTRRLRRDGHAVTTLTRSARAADEVAWDPAAPGGEWCRVVAGADAVVNLAGESIAGARWTAARRAAIRDSRVVATRALATAIAGSATPPAVFVSGSAVGVYGGRGDERGTTPERPGAAFLADVCRRWEEAALTAGGATRIVLARTGVVLAGDGGALPQMALPFRFFAGGRVGSGRQWVSWIHIDDWVEMLRWALVEPAVRGPLDVTAPEPVTNAELARSLGRVLHRPALLPVPAFALRLALGDMADMLLTGQRVLPRQAQAGGFVWAYPRLEPALRAIYGRA